MRSNGADCRVNTQRKHYYTSADFPDNSGQLDVSGWLATATAYYYDAEGHALHYQYTQPNVETTAYTVSYLKKDTYLEQATTGTSPTPNLVTTTDTRNKRGQVHFSMLAP